MTTRKPLTLDDAVVSLLLSGDTLDPTALGSGTPHSTDYLAGDGTWQPTSSLMPTDPATGTNQTTQIGLEGDIKTGIGLTSDGAVYGSSAGSMSAKLRGLLSLLTGRSVATTPSSAAVTSSSSSAIASNSSRTGCVITNLGPGNVSFGDGATAVVNSGITLMPGGTWVMDRYTFTQNAIFVISPTTAALSIQEYN